MPRPIQRMPVPAGTDGPRISAGEAYLLVACAITADLINWIPVLNFVSSAVFLPGFQVYFYMKGVRGTYSLVGNVIDTIPVISALPATTAGVVATIVADRNADRLSSLGSVGNISGKKS